MWREITTAATITWSFTMARKRATRAGSGSSAATALLRKILISAVLVLWPIYSDAGHLFVQFVSDLSLTADGFICHYAFKPKNSAVTGSRVPVTAAPPTTAAPIALVYSEALCKQKCKRSGTIEMLTGTLVSAAMREHSVLATFSIGNVYKEGNLSIQQAGKSMSTKVVILCKKCPLVRRGLNYIVMGQVDEQGQGVVLPQNFVMAFKAKKQRDLAVLNNVRC